MFTRLSILLLLCILFRPDASAQELIKRDTGQYIIETTDGNEYIGVILSEDQEKIILKTEQLGEITLLKKNIKNMEKLGPVIKKGEEYWIENPQSTRYFWAPNGYGLKKGEGYYQNVWVLFNQFSVGVTDHFSIGAGMVPLFFFGGSSTPVWITPKVSIPVTKDKFNVGAGALMGTVLGEEETGFGILYGTTTFGSRDKNVSIGLGYGYAGGDWANTPTITFSSLIRTGRRSYFITENYYIGTADEAAVILSVGGRRLIKRAGLDYGLFIPFVTDQESFILIPWLGITLPFGK